MANDPAFLFYPGDYLRDTQCLSERSQVAYDRIMCEHMRKICITQAQLDFFTKRLTVDEKSELLMVIQPTEGGFHIPWVTDSIMKRREYSESRRKNRKSAGRKAQKTSSTHDQHMENEIEVEIENEITEASDFEKCENLFFGHIPEDLHAIVRNLEPRPDADSWQVYVHEQLELHGWGVKREVPCKYPDGNDGRIDLVAIRNGYKVAIELDYRVARKNSIVKVRTYPAGMVLLRDPKLKPKAAEPLPGASVWNDELYREHLERLGKNFSIRDVKALLDDWEAWYMSKFEWRKKDLQEMRLSFESWIRNPKSRIKNEQAKGTTRTTGAIIGKQDYSERL